MSLRVRLRSLFGGSSEVVVDDRPQWVTRTITRYEPGEPFPADPPGKPVSPELSDRLDRMYDAYEQLLHEEAQALEGDEQ